MNFSQLANPRILDQPVYQPGKPIGQVAREHKLNPKDVCKLASNENPWGASPLAIAAGSEALKHVHLYPEGSGQELRNALGKNLQLEPSQIILGNGSNEVIELLGHVFLEEGDEVIVGEHAFVVYKLMALLMGATPVVVPMPNLVHDLNEMYNAITDKTKLIFLPSPNNPTGTANSAAEIIQFVESLPDHVIFCLDEAYAEYLQDPPDIRPFIKQGKKVLAMRTFSKIHGLAGLRIGYGYGNEELIELLQKARQPFNVNSIAQASAIAALEDKDWVAQCRKRNLDGLKQMATGLENLNLEYIRSKANFLMIKVGDGQAIFHSLQTLGIITRPMPQSLKEFIRISIGTEEENFQALTALKQVLS
ncbi:MAG: histidinol-phosphate transaminase [Opitutales bacterium]|jgi:histidinol-phosphate aminotransferase|tara:strand:- start:1648 stop:2736 length:1089 start_codon:yes stop_codon:yes gene_type:complete